MHIVLIHKINHYVIQEICYSITSLPLHVLALTLDVPSSYFILFLNPPDHTEFSDEIVGVGVTGLLGAGILFDILFSTVSPDGGPVSGISSGHTLSLSKGTLMEASFGFSTRTTSAPPSYRVKIRYGP